MRITFHPRITNNHRVRRAVQQAVVICLNFWLLTITATVILGYSNYLVIVFATGFPLSIACVFTVWKLSKARIAKGHREIQLLLERINK